MRALYKGFSTYDRRKKFRLTDFDLVKQDLFNALHIRQGEKLMNPKYGTIIWNMLFEPFTANIRDLIVNDVTRIIAGEPRVQLEGITVDAIEYGLIISLDLRYKQTNELETMQIMFDQRSVADR